MREFLTFLTVAIIIAEFIFLGVTLYEKHETENAVNGLPVLSTESSVKGAIKENRQQVIVSYAPLSGEPVQDDMGILTKEYDIPADKIAYVKYQQQEYEYYQDTEGNTQHQWSSCGVPTVYASPKVYIYDDIPIGMLSAYSFSGNTVTRYDIDRGGVSLEGDKRYVITYVTFDDTISGMAYVGDNMCQFANTFGGLDIVVNGSVENISQSSGSKYIFRIILSIFLCVFVATFTGVISLVLKNKERS